MYTSNNSEMPTKIPIHFVDDDETSFDSSVPFDAVFPQGLSHAEDALEKVESVFPQALSDGEVLVYHSSGELAMSDEEFIDDPEVIAAISFLEVNEANEANRSAEEITSSSIEIAAIPPHVFMEQDAAAASVVIAARLERVEAELTMVNAERQELLERVTRVYADFENFRKRVEREKSRTFQGLAGDVARNLLPVLDNLQRAVEAQSSVQGSESEEFRHFLNGVELIHRQLTEVLESLGLKPVDTVGLPFNPHVHEAVATEYSEQLDRDTVVEEVVRGYHIGDTLLRPAMVRVSTR